MTPPRRRRRGRPSSPQPSPSAAASTSTAGPRRQCEGDPHNKQLLRRPVPAATGQAHALRPCPSFQPACACVRASGGRRHSEPKSHGQVVSEPRQGGAEGHVLHLLGAGVRVRGRPSSGRPSALNSVTYWAQGASSHSPVHDVVHAPAPPRLSPGTLARRACQVAVAPLLLLQGPEDGRCHQGQGPGLPSVLGGAGPPGVLSPAQHLRGAGHRVAQGGGIQHRAWGRAGRAVIAAAEAPEPSLGPLPARGAVPRAQGCSRRVPSRQGSRKWLKSSCSCSFAWSAGERPALGGRGQELAPPPLRLPLT